MERRTGIKPALPVGDRYQSTNDVRLSYTMPHGSRTRVRTSNTWFRAKRVTGYTILEYVGGRRED